MSNVVNNHLNNLYVLSNKALGPGKKSKLINVGPTSILEARVLQCACAKFCHMDLLENSHFGTMYIVQQYGHFGTFW